MAKKYSGLLPGEHVLLSLSISGAMQALLANGETEDLAKDLVVRCAQESGRPAGERVALPDVVSTASGPLMLFAATLSLSGLKEAGLVQGEGEQLTDLAREMVSMMESGKRHPEKEVWE